VNKMKIDNNVNKPPALRTNNKIQQTNNIDSSSVDFQTQLNEISKKEIKKRLNKLMDIVDKQGKKLKKTFDNNDLLEYKSRVKDFLRLIQKEFVQARQSYSWDARGNLKTYTIIEKVDKNLELLHNLFLEEQADVLTIVKKIDEIRGLLLDLYI